MKYLKNKAPGFYVSTVAAVLALAGLFLYCRVKNSESMIVLLLAAVAGLQAAAAVLLIAVKGNRWMNLIIMAEAVLAAGALVFSFRTQVDALGYVVSGLYGAETVLPYVMSVVCMTLSLILCVIASYYGFEKDRM